MVARPRFGLGEMVVRRVGLPHQHQSFGPDLGLNSFGGQCWPGRPRRRRKAGRRPAGRRPAGRSPAGQRPAGRMPDAQRVRTTPAGDRTDPTQVGASNFPSEVSWTPFLALALMHLGDPGTGPGDPGTGPGVPGTDPGVFGSGPGVPGTDPGVPQVLVLFCLGLGT